MKTRFLSDIVSNNDNLKKIDGNERVFMVLHNLRCFARRRSDSLRIYPGTSSSLQLRLMNL